MTEYDNVYKDLQERLSKMYETTGNPALVNHLSKKINDLTIEKRGVKLPMSWEALHRTESRYGTYVPTGNKLLQRVHWAYGLALYKTWRWLEKRLDKNRHFHGVSGYEWEDAEYRKFKQATKWVETEIQEEEK